MGSFLNRKFSSISNDANNPTSLIRPSQVGKRFRVTDILVCNTTGTDATASILIREQGTLNPNNLADVGTDFFMIKGMLVPANTSIEIIDGEYPLYWQSGTPYYDHLMGYASASGVDLIIGVYEE